MDKLFPKFNNLFFSYLTVVEIDLQMRHITRKGNIMHRGIVEVHTRLHIYAVLEELFYCHKLYIDLKETVDKKIEIFA